MRKLAIVLIPLLILALVLGAIGCDQDASLQDAIARAIAKTSEASSYRSAANSTTYRDIITYGASAEIEYVAPDRLHMRAIVSVDGGGNVSPMMSINGEYVAVSGDWMELIIVGDKGYMRSSRESQWQVCEVRAPDWQRPLPSPRIPAMPPIPSTPPVPLATPTSTPTTTPTPTEDTCSVAHPQSLEELFEDLNLLSDLEKLPDEEIDGVNCSHYRGRIDQDSYVDIWIDGDDYIRQKRSEIRFDEEWISTIRYFDFNEPICIEPPKSSASP